MPTLLVPTLAVVALLPLTTSRPPPEYVGGTNLLPTDATTTIDALLSCIEDDKTLIDRLQTCMEHDPELEVNVKDGNDIYFGLLDGDWQRLQLHQREFPENLLLKGKLVRVFRELLASFYRAHIARLTNEIEAYKKTSPDNATKNDYINEILGTTRITNGHTDTPELLGGSPLSPMSTDEPPSEDHSSKEIILDEAGSDPEYTFINPYGVEGENNEIQKYIYESEVTTSQLDSLTTKVYYENNSLDSDSYRSTTYTVMTTTMPLENAEMKHESPPPNDNIIVSEGKHVYLPDLPTTFNLDRNMGTDIDENELFPPMKITSSTEPTDEGVSTKNLLDSSGNYKIDVYYNTTPDQNNAERINPTESSYHSSQYAKSNPNDSIASQNVDEQTYQTTDPSLNELYKKQPFTNAIATSDFAYAISTPNSNVQGKENYPDTEDSSGPINSVAKIMPTGPSISPSVPNYNTPSDVETNKKNMDPLSIKPDVYTTSEKQVSYSPSTGTFSEYENILDNQPLTNLPESQNTNEVADLTEAYESINYHRTTDIEDSKQWFGTEASTVLNQLSSISPVPSVNETFDSKSGRGESKDYQTKISNIDTTFNLTPQETKSPTDSVTYPFEKAQFPIDVSSTQGADSNRYDETNTSDDTKGITITLDIAITSQEPDFKDRSEHQGHTTAVDSAIGDASPSLPVSDKGSDINSPVPDSNSYKDTTTEPVFAFSLTPQSKSRDNLSIDPGTEYDQKLTSTVYKDTTTEPVFTFSLTPQSKSRDNLSIDPGTEYDKKLTSTVYKDTTTEPVFAFSLTPQSKSRDNLSIDPGTEYDKKLTSTVYKDTTTEPYVPLTPQSKSQDEVSIDRDTEYDQKSTSTEVHLFDDNKSNTKIFYNIESTTENNIIPVKNDITIDLKRGDRTESLNKFHTFAIPLPELKKEKKSNVVVNTLRIFPADNEHMVIFQPSYKRGCLSNNECVRVGSVANRDAKQRRAPSNVDGVEGGGGKSRHVEGDLDSVLWWHKMRALKKKSR